MNETEETQQQDEVWVDDAESVFVQVLKFEDVEQLNDVQLARYIAQINTAMSQIKKLKELTNSIMFMRLEGSGDSFEFLFNSVPWKIGFKTVTSPRVTDMQKALLLNVAEYKTSTFLSASPLSRAAKEDYFRNLAEESSGTQEGK